MGLKAFLRGGLEGLSVKKEYPVYGPGGHFGGGFDVRTLLSGSTFDYAREAGPLYDNSVVQSAINWIWRKIPEASIRLEQLLDPVEDKWAGVQDTSGLIQSIRKPNDHYDGTTLIQGTALSDTVRGNGYWLIRRGKLDQVIGYNYAAHFQMQARSDKDNAHGTKLITHWHYFPLGGGVKPVETRDVIHIRFGLDPVNPAYGLSPLMAQAREVVVDNSSGTHMGALLRNGGRPKFLIAPKVEVQKSPTPEQKERARELLSGFDGDNNYETGIAPYPMELIMPGFSPEQMVLDKVRSIPAGRICGAVGIDPMVLSICSEHQTFNNYEHALRAALLNCFLPMLWRISEHAGFRLLDEFGLDSSTYRLGWDTSRIIGLQEDTDAMHTRWRENFKAGGVDRATFKERIGEQPDPADVGVYAAAKPNLSDLMGGDPTADAPPPPKKALLGRNERPFDHGY